jgi:hypothetical protein
MSLGKDRILSRANRGVSVGMEVTIWDYLNGNFGILDMV